MGIPLSKGKEKKQQASANPRAHSRIDAECDKSNRLAITSLLSPGRRRKMNSGFSSGGTRAVEDAQGADTIETGKEGKERKVGNRLRSSRRRTRSMVTAEQTDEEGEGMAEYDDSKRMRRKIKGKFKAAEEADPQEGDSRRQAKGKDKQRDGVESTEMPTEDVSARAEGSSSGGDTPSLGIAPAPNPLIDEAASSQDQSNQALPYTPLNPFDISSQERSRARSQVTQALGLETAAQLQSGRLPSTDTYRPSMLSALLTDILGLRSTQMAAAAASSVNGGIGRTPPPASNTSESRQRTGGTSVIVQGALISRTLPSRPAEGVGSEPTSAAQSTATEAAPPPATQPSVHPSGPVRSNRAADAEGLDQLGAEPQVATIEEQAAMLIRLLSIATAATAASLVSRAPATQVTPEQGEGESSEMLNRSGTGAGSSAHPAGTDTDQAHSATSEAAARRQRSLSTSTSSSALSSSSSWRQASQTLQMLRDRISAVRRRLQSLRLPRVGESDRSRLESHRTSAEGANGLSQQEGDASGAQGRLSLPSPGTEVRAASHRREVMTGSLDSLSSMLQDAIRQGVPGQNHHEGRRSGSDSQDGVNSSHAESRAGQSRHVQATLDAVRDGHLTRGDEGTFARFLFDLMGDLDVAVRRMPTARTSGAADAVALDEDTLLRRQRDLHEGQLSFFRLFTFPNASPGTGEAGVASGPRQTSTSNELLPCLVVGVRSLEANQIAPGERPAEQPRTGGVDPSVVLGNASPAAPANGSDAATGIDVPQGGSGSGAMMSRFLLFVSGGHYPPQHPLFHSTTDEASRDLMVLIEFLGAMTSIHPKPSTVTKEQIDNSSIQTVTGGVNVIASMVQEKKVMENTSERCLICLEDWTDEDKARRLLDCAHLFHAPCIDQWLIQSNNSCPLCRRQAVATTRTPISEHVHSQTPPTTSAGL